MTPALDKTHPALTVLPQPTAYHLHQYPSTSPLPSWTSSSSLSFLSMIRTPHELSIVYSSEERIEDEAEEYEGPWRALRVNGPMELTMTGVLHALTGPLKEASVPIFALSTWCVNDTRLEGLCS
jgi:hypothetical protein